jgi:hypothetical protein
MKLYIAVVESPQRQGRRVKLALHASTKRAAESMIAARYAKWKLEAAPNLRRGRGE